MIFKTIDKQELFDLATNGVIAQGAPAVLPAISRQCVYVVDRGDCDDLKCGIGHCLTDTALDTYGMFRGSVTALYAQAMIDNPLTNKKLDDDLMIFLEELQNIHDNATRIDLENTEEDFIVKFQAGVELFASLHDLTIQSPN